LLAQVGQAGMANVASKLPGGAAALHAYDAYNTSSAGKPVAAVAPTLGLPGSLPRIGAEVLPSIPKKSVI
jgi:type VI secretion system secreted protein VgrG